MDYRSMNLKQLYDELRKRDLGTPALRNEIGKIYGVTYLPPQQAEARKEAIEILERDDSRKFSWTKLAKKVDPIVAIIVGIVTLIGVVIALF